MKILKKYYLSIFFLLIFGFNFSQTGNYLVNDFDKNLSNAVKELKKISEFDTLRVNALEEIYVNAIFLSQKKKVLKYANEANEISKKIGFTNGSCRYYYWKANYYRSDLKIDATFLCIDSLNTISKDVNSKYCKRFRALGEELKGTIYLSQDNYYTAIKHFLRALTYFEKNHELKTIAIYRQLSEIYFILNNYNKSKEYSKLLLNIINSNKVTEGKLQLGIIEVEKTSALLNLVSIALNEKKHSEAKNYLNYVSKSMPDTLNLDLTSQYYIKKGALSFSQNEIDSSFVYYNTAYGYAEQFEHSETINNALFYLSKIALKKGDYEKSKFYAEKNLELAKDENDKSYMIGSLRNLSEYYNIIGNSNKAFILLKESIAIKDTLLSEKNIKQINTLQAIYETEKKQTKILELNNENEKKSTLNKILIITSIFILLISFLGYKIFRNKQKLQNLKISELEKDKQILVIDSMLKGQEEERSRIAKDLHDGIGGLLSGTKLSFTTMKENLILTPENVIQFDKSLSMLDSTMSDLRKVAHNLMPEALVKFGLNEALKDFCSSIQSTKTVNIIYQKLGLDKKYDNTTDVFIYRIIQELVNNALKHAQAKEILVQLATNENNIHITVEDDGIGYDTNTINSHKGSGLANIEYRVNYLTGTIDTVSSPNKGTAVNIEFKV